MATIVTRTVPFSPLIIILEREEELIALVHGLGELVGEDGGATYQLYRDLKQQLREESKP